MTATSPGQGTLVSGGIIMDDTNVLMVDFRIGLLRIGMGTELLPDLIVVLAPC